MNVVRAQAALSHPAVTAAIERAPDRDAARAGLERLFEAHPARVDEILADERVLAGATAVVCASRSLLLALVADAGAIDALGGAVSPQAAPHDGSGLRRWKRRRLIDIATRDLLREIDLRTVGRELATLAADCLTAALAIAAPREPLAVVGMGKLGGRELNYASDVDVLFAHDGAPDEAERAARAVLRAMSAPGPDGIVFRTDAALRPEGRAGPLSRSVESYAAYWAQWAQPWERQALIKFRTVAGDAELGETLTQRATEFVWHVDLEADALRSLRAMKAATEAAAAPAGDREIKRASGGIRDIEFAVQLLQLVHGRADAALRSPTTLDALEALAAGGYIAIEDARVLDEAYVWLRNVEHRIQLVDEQQTHTLPESIAARDRLARVLGYRDHGIRRAYEQLDGDLREWRSHVRTIHERVYFAPVLDALSGRGALTVDATLARLGALGFTDAEQTRAAVQELSAGLTRRSRLMRQLLPLLFDWLVDTPDPDLGLLQLRRLAEGPTRSALLAHTVRDDPVAAQRTCALLGASRVLGGALYHSPDFLARLGDDAEVATARPRDALVSAAEATLDWRHDDDARRAALRRFKRREVLRIGARDLLGLAGGREIAHELTDLADACVEATLRSLEPRIPFAVIAMGRYGGRELSYVSDLDVLLVHGGRGARDAAAADRIGRALVAGIARTTVEGKVWDVDADLRPEGAAGVLVRSLDAYSAYYTRWAQLWERQALLRARVAAGDPDLGARFIALIEPFVYRQSFSEAEAREVREMKARIERERLGARAGAGFDLKLGHGATSDVEWTVQLLQLRHGAHRPDVRTPSTLDALERLEHAGLISAPDSRVLGDSYAFCDRARGYRYLIAGTPSDALPVDRAEAIHLGRMLGLRDRPATQLRDEYRRRTRRARAVVERMLYGAPG